MRNKLSGIRKGNPSPEKQFAAKVEDPEPGKFEAPKESVDLLDL